MTVEHSELNTSAALPTGTVNLHQNSGDGNSTSAADLAKGFTSLPAPETASPWLPQNANDGENYVGDPFGRGGFAGRPQGTQR